MNASVLSPAREVQVQSEIRKIRGFSRYARIVCSAIFGFGIVGVVFVLLVAALGLFFPRIHSATTTTLAITPQLKMLTDLVAGVMASVMLAGVYQLGRLFGNLAAGAIYTAENVRRVRYLGLVSLLWVVLAVAIPSALLALGYRDSPLPKSLTGFSWPELLNSVISAGLLLLVSWIMDVGLHTKEHADALQRDADLVI